MLGFNDTVVSSSKFFVSNGSLPAYIDPHQPPSAKKPFSTILNQPFTHTVELLLPEQLYDLIWQDVLSKIGVLEYARVIMSLSEIIAGDFFNTYIKRGNILMISEGRPGIDNRYTLRDGKLRLDLGKETYERAGLIGKPILDGGRKHLKTRYSVEIDLRQPSMLHGKKGFERIVWAFKNVLNHSVTWLFHDFDKLPKDVSEPISKHHPTNFSVPARQDRMEAIIMPSFSLAETSDSDAGFKDWAIDILEWLGLTSLSSPRVTASDSIDPYLSRYQIPETNNSDSANDPCNLIKLSWNALIPTSWIRNLFITLVARCGKVSETTTTTTTSTTLFFALSAKAFEIEVRGQQQDGYTILCPLIQQQQHTLSQHTTNAHHQSKKQKHAERQGLEFVVWAVSER